jgi:hypothetical protein
MNRGNMYEYDAAAQASAGEFGDLSPKATTSCPSLHLLSHLKNCSPLLIFLGVVASSFRPLAHILAGSRLLTTRAIRRTTLFTSHLKQ